MSTAESAAQSASGPEAAPHVVVIGGGVAGLVAARDLVRGGARVTLLEASDHLGGKVLPHTVGGLVLDAGAESYATREGTVAALVAELGLGDAIVRPGSAGAWLSPADAPPLPLPNAGLLGIPAVPLAADVIAVVGLAGALRAQLDSLMSGFVGSKERTLGGLVRKRMGRAVLERLVTPVAGSIHSAHPDELEVDVVAPRLRAAMLDEGSLARAVLTLRAAAPAGSAVEGLEGGVFRLVDELARALEGRADIRLSTPVVPVADPDALHDALHGDGTVQLASGERIAADHVVLAAPLGATPGVPIVIVTLVVEGADVSAVLDSAPRGNGVLVAPGDVPGPGARAKALTHATAKWDWLRARAAGRHVIRLSYDSVPAVESELRELARRDASTLLGVDIPARSVVGFARVDWTGPPSRPPEAGRLPSRVTVVGESVAGAGLAAIVGHSRAETGNLLRSLRDESGLRWGPTRG